MDDRKWIGTNSLFVTSGFTTVVLNPARYPVPPKAVVMYSSLGLIIIPSAEVASLIFIPCSSQTWVPSTTHDQRLASWGQPPHLIQWTRPQGWDHLRVRSLGILVYPSPPDLFYLHLTFFIGSIFSSLHMG